MAVRPKSELRAGVAARPPQSASSSLRPADQHSADEHTSFAPAAARGFAARAPFWDATRASGSGGERAALWYSFGGKNREVLEQLSARFHRDPRRPRVDATFQGDYFESLAKVRTAIAAGAAPALSRMSCPKWFPTSPKRGHSNRSTGTEGVAELDLVHGIAQSGTYLGGAERPLFAIPFNRSVPVMYVNQGMLERAGVGIPRNWTEFRTAAQRADECGAARKSPCGDIECPVSWWFWVALMASAGGNVVDASGVVTLGGDAGVPPLDFMAGARPDRDSGRSALHSDATTKRGR